MDDDLYALALKVLGDDIAATLWWTRPSDALDGETPQAIAAKLEGTERIRTVLEKMQGRWH